MRKVYKMEKKSNKKKLKNWAPVTAASPVVIEREREREREPSSVNLLVVVLSGEHIYIYIIITIFAHTDVARRWMGMGQWR